MIEINLKISETKFSSSKFSSLFSFYMIDIPNLLSATQSEVLYITVFFLRWTGIVNFRIHHYWMGSVKCTGFRWKTKDQIFIQLDKMRNECLSLIWESRDILHWVLFWSKEQFFLRWWILSLVQLCLGHRLKGCH